MPESVQTPEWVRDAIFYQIFPDRFAQSDKVAKPSNIETWDSPPTPGGYKAGDLLGVVEHLDYLQDLGVNALYLNPIFQSASNHRYHTHDYLQVDPILGGNAAFRTLLDACHARDMRVVLDGVFNHASRGFYQFNQTLEEGAASPYTDWFTFQGFPVQAYGAGAPNYEAWWDLPALPKFNTNTPAVRKFLWDVGRYWMEFGIDGWRLDVPNEIDDDLFWQEFRRAVKGVNPDGYITGEIWGDARRWLAGDQFDSVMNYLFTKLCLGFFVTDPDHHMTDGVGYAPIPTLDAGKFGADIAALLGLYPKAVTDVQLNLLSSHDTPRFLSVARDDGTALKLATLFQMCYPGAPSIYYGDEIGLRGGKEPASRNAFPWAESAWDTDMRDWFKRAIALRTAHPALRRGDFTTLHNDHGLYIFSRSLDGQTLIVALNVAAQPNDLSHTRLPGLADGTIEDIWNGGAHTITGGAFTDLVIPARSAAVLRI